MEKFFDRIICADALQVLKEIPDGLVQTCITSPPYWGLRDYGVEGQLGLERTPDEYVQKLVEVFREVRRVLAPDGTLWLNVGDSYATGAGKVGEHPGGGTQGARFKAMWGHRGFHDPSPMHTMKQVPNGKNPNAGIPLFQPNRMPIPGLKPKDLVGIPWMLAFALRGDGWWLRSDIIWHKPNGMPASVRDRPTTAHEYLFLLTKSARYYFNRKAILEPCRSGPSDTPGFAPGWNSAASTSAKSATPRPSR